MTTAPDLPLPALVPYPAEPSAAPADVRPSLTLVPSQPLPGEEIELDEALRRAGPRLKRYATRRLHDEHEAEEVVQEALLRAFQHQHLLATEDDLMAWLTVVTGRLVIDRLRVRGRSTPVAELPPATRAGRDTADVVVARDEARIALDALESMPGRQASVLWAREVEGLSYDEIGDRFGMSEPSVRSLLHRARRTLRREYAVRGGTLPGIGLVALAPWLHGLRFAGRLRHVARRGASAAAVAATGLAVVTVVPFGPQQSPVHAAPAMTPALGKATSVAVTHRTTHPRHVRPAAAVTARSGGAPTAAPSGHVTSSHLAGPSLCGRHDYSVNCVPHSGQTLYVGPPLPVPVAGVHRVGVSSSKVKCTAVPTTAVTKCDSRGASQ
ncbi:MAG: polymerase sigma-70 factor, subfamily [Frankiaceae bacterium]|jgi:RNA polymerase sigma-70 factor (ECF subfamily)|nr:polymerase sigma-70 factor, subfamily [Frankiaceae bacterium]